MVTIVPVEVIHASVVGVVLHDLLLGETIAVSICVFATGHLDELAGTFLSKRSFAKVRGNWWSHLLEHHHIVFRHHLRIN